MNSFKRYWAIVLLTFGCAGTSRSCASCVATNYGADWVVVQTDQGGRPFRCWSFRNVSIANEQGSDGIYWQEEGGNLVHISNHYNRVQVVSRNWNAAYRELGLSRETCQAIRNAQYDTDSGTYLIPGTPQAVRGTVTLGEPEQL